VVAFGNVWGTLAGASLIGFLQKGDRMVQPVPNTLAAQTYMVLFIILFIQIPSARASLLQKGRQRRIDPMRKTFPFTNPSVMWLHRLSGLFTLLSQSVQRNRHRLIFARPMVKDLVKTLCLFCFFFFGSHRKDCGLGYCGILSLGHFAFFGIGGYAIRMWLMYARTERHRYDQSRRPRYPATPKEGAGRHRQTDFRRRWQL